MTSNIRDIAWWFWLVTDALLVTWLAGNRWAIDAAIALTFVQAVYFALRAGRVSDFAVQVRAAYLAMLAAGLYVPALRWFHWIQLGGTMAVVVVGYCPLARLLSLMPWNRSRPLTWPLVQRTLFVLDPLCEANCS